MKIPQKWLVSILLLCSCQELAAPTAKGPATPIAVAATTYEESVSKLYKTYSFQSAKTNGSQVIGMMPMIAGPMPTSPSPQNLSQMPAMTNAPTVGSPSSGELKKILPSLKVAYENVLKLTQDMLASLKSLTPPPEKAEEQQILLTYFTDQIAFIKAMIETLSLSDPQMQEHAFRNGLSTKFQQLNRTKMRADTILAKMFLTPYRQERLKLQQGPELSKTDYQAALKSIMAPHGLMQLILATRPDSLSSTQLLSDVQTRLKSLGALHPPTAQEEMHTFLFAAHKLSYNISDKLKTKIKPQEPGKQTSATEMSATLLMFFNDEELLHMGTEMSLYLTQFTQNIETLYPNGSTPFM